MYYYTHYVGDAFSLPIIRVPQECNGIGMLNADAYYTEVMGPDWYTNQNNPRSLPPGLRLCARYDAGVANVRVEWHSLAGPASHRSADDVFNMIEGTLGDKNN